MINNDTNTQTHMAHATQPWQALKEVEEVSDELMARSSSVDDRYATGQLSKVHNWDITVAKSLFNTLSNCK